jgi:hypothetical protein
MNGAAIGTIAVVVVALAGPPARAAGSDASCAPAGRPWLRVTFAGDSFDAALQARVGEQLGIDLGGHRIGLCEASDAPSGASPLADVSISLTKSTDLSLEVVDAVTDKRMQRRVSIATVPRDARALAIALAAEELLHASWIEAALEPPAEPLARPAPAAIPVEVREVNRETLARAPSFEDVAASGWMQTTILAAGERSAGGQTDLGGDLRFAAGKRFVVAADVGYRAAPDVASTHGSVRGSELLAALGLGYLLQRRDAPWGAQVAVRGSLVDVQFQGIAAAGAVAAPPGSQLAALLGASLGGWRSLGGPWSLVLDAGLAAPLRAVTASDAGATVTGVSGVIFGLAFGVAATLTP